MPVEVLFRRAFVIFDLISSTTRHTTFQNQRSKTYVPVARTTKSVFPSSRGAHVMNRCFAEHPGLLLSPPPIAPEPCLVRMHCCAVRVVACTPALYLVALKTKCRCKNLLISRKKSSSSTPALEVGVPVARNSRSRILTIVINLRVVVVGGCLRQLERGPYCLARSNLETLCQRRSCQRSSGNNPSRTQIYHSSEQGY